MHLEQSASLAEQEGDRRGAAHAYSSLGELCLVIGEPSEGVTWLRKAMAIARAIDNPQCALGAGTLLVRCLIGSNDEASARQVADQLCLYRGAATDEGAIAQFDETLDLLSGQRGAVQGLPGAPLSQHGPGSGS